MCLRQLRLSRIRTYNSLAPCILTFEQYLDLSYHVLSAAQPEREPFLSTSEKEYHISMIRVLKPRIPLDDLADQIRERHRYLPFQYLHLKDKDVDHINKKRDDNRVGNLQIIDRQDHITKDSGVPIIVFCNREGRYFKEEYPSITAAAKATGLSITTVSKASKDYNPRDNYIFFRKDDPNLSMVLEHCK